MVKLDYDLSISNILQSIILLTRVFCSISMYIFATERTKPEVCFTFLLYN